MEMSKDKPLVDVESVIDREQVDLIYKILERQNILLLTGIAGIGKTTIANLYHHKYQNEYSSILRVDYSRFEDPQNQIEKLIGDLNKSIEKRLLILDDIDKNGLLNP